MYSVEEHHDDFTFRLPNDPTDYRNLSITIPDNRLDEQINDSRLAEEVNLLIAAHSNPSVNSHSQSIGNFSDFFFCL